MNSPIGVFDSGVGGVSFLIEASKRLPDEDFIYFGDNLNVPYGPRPEEEIRNLAFQAADLLIERGVKAMVVACNTASSAAITPLRERYSLPIIGLEPAIKPALEATGDKPVLVLATQGTLSLPRFQNLVAQLHAEHRSVVLPAPWLVLAVERGDSDEQIGALLKEHLPPEAANCAAVVLGCTHFIFAHQAIRNVFGPQMMIVDGNRGAAEQLIRRLNEEGLRGGGQGRVAFLTSGGEDALALMHRLYEKGLAHLGE